MASSRKMQAIVEIGGVVGASLSKSMQQANKKLGAGNKAVAALGKAAGKAALAAGAAAVSAAATAAGAVANITKQSIQQYAEYEQLAGGAKLMFGEAYDYIADKAQKAYATVQLSQNDYMRQVNGFATGLKNSMGGNVQAAAELADRIVTAEADVVAAVGVTQEEVQNAFNGVMKSNFMMLDNLKLGIKPTKEGMQEVIDKVNDWNAANGKATAYQMDNLADMEAALVDYVKMQGLAGYAANEAMDTVQGSLASTKAAWQNLLTAMGDGNADLTSYIDGLVTSSTALVHNVMPVAERALGGVSKLVAELLPQIAKELPSIIREITPSVIDAAAGTAEAAVDVLPEVLEAILPALAGVLSRVSSELFGIPQEQMDAMLGDMSATLEQIIPTLSSIFSATFSFLGTAVQMLAPIISAVLPAVSFVLEVIADVLTRISANEGVVKMLTTVVGIVLAVVAAIKAWQIAQMALNIVLSLNPLGVIILAIGAVIAAVAIVISYWDEIVAALQPVAEKVADIFRGIGQFIADFWDGLVNVVKAPINGIIDVLNWFIGKLNTLSFTLPDIAILGEYRGMTIGFDIPEIPHLAVGGFTTGPSLAGEAGTEAVISFDPRYRLANLQTWATAGQMLTGTDSVSAAAGKLLGLDDFSLEGLAGDTYIYIDYGGITFAPVIHGDTEDADDIIEKLRRREEEFLALLEEFTARREAAVYA